MGIRCNNGILEGWNNGKIEGHRAKSSEELKRLLFSAYFCTAFAVLCVTLFIYQYKYTLS